MRRAVFALVFLLAGTSTGLAQTIYLEGGILDNTPIVLDQANATYVLMEDVTAVGSAFAMAGTADGATLDLNRHTVTWGTGSGDLRFGVVVCSNTHYVDRYPDIPPGAFGNGGAANVTIRNGAFVQGAGEGANCSAVYGRASAGTRVTEVDATIIGIDCRGVTFAYANNIEVDHCTITNESPWVTNRHQGRASIDFEEAGDSTIRIHHNTVVGGPQWGIRIRRGSAHEENPSTWYEIYNNDVSQNTVVTNGYAIGAQASQVRIYDNYLHPVNGRGIHVTRRAIEIYGNTIDVFEMGNSEYIALEAHGIKLEGCTDAEVWDNDVTARARHDSDMIFVHPITGVERNVYAMGTALNLGLTTGSNFVIRDNTFRGIHEGGDQVDGTDHYNDYSAACFFRTLQPNSGLTMENNIFISNSELVGISWDVDGGGAVFRNTSLERDYSNADNHVFVETYWANSQDAGTFTFLNPSIGADLDLRNCGSRGNTGDYALTLDWTIDFVVQNADGAPIAGASVTVRDDDDQLVHQELTGADGLVQIDLREFRAYKVSGSPGTEELNPYQARAEFGEQQTSVTVVADSRQTVALVLDGLPSEYPGMPGQVNLEQLGDE